MGYLLHPRYRWDTYLAWWGCRKRATGQGRGTSTSYEQQLRTNVKRFLVFKAHRLLYHPTLGSRVIKKKKEKDRAHVDDAQPHRWHLRVCFVSGSGVRCRVLGVRCRV